MSDVCAADLGGRAEADWSAAVVAARDDHGILCRALAVAVERHVRAHAAVFDQVRLVGDREQVAAGDRHRALRANGGGQELNELRRRAGVALDADCRAALADRKSTRLNTSP